MSYDQLYHSLLSERVETGNCEEMLKYLTTIAFFLGAGG